MASDGVSRRLRQRVDGRQRIVQPRQHFWAVVQVAGLRRHLVQVGGFVPAGAALDHDHDHVGHALHDGNVQRARVDLTILADQFARQRFVVRHQRQVQRRAVVEI